MPFPALRATIEAMHTAPPPSRAAGTNGNWRLPSLENDDVKLAGVASGAAAELGVPTAWVRIAFVFLFTIGGLGGYVYVGMWALFRWAETSGLGMSRKGGAGLRGRSSQHRLAAVVLITAGIAAGGGSLIPANPAISFAGSFVLLGLGLAWRTSSAPTAQMPGRDRIRQLGGGLVSVVLGLSIMLAQIDSIPFLLGAGVIALVGTIVVSGPWIYGVVADFDEERQARIRSDERAEVAAHIHDSVLQTLALIQKAEDPQTAKNLARRQERELRNWLDPKRASRVGGSIRGHLDQLVSDVEERHGVPVEVVAVGDALVDQPIQSLLKAAREACVNAANHSGTDRVDIYVEVTDDYVELFVRDTGKGFEMSGIDADRRGVSESIIGRMERAGGTATITSEIGEGTEIELRIDREPADQEK